MLYAPVLFFQGITHTHFAFQVPFSGAIVLKACPEPVEGKHCHAFCKLHELAARQPLLSWTATSFSPLLNPDPPLRSGSLGFRFVHSSQSLPVHRLPLVWL